MLPDVGALMEPTMPTGQWGCGMSCLQKNQIGSDVFVIVRFQVGKPEVVPIGIRILPESKPFPSGSHGSLKEDWVIEWFPGLRIPTNFRVSQEE